MALLWGPASVGISSKQAVSNLILGFDLVSGHVE